LKKWPPQSVARRKLDASSYITNIDSRFRDGELQQTINPRNLEDD
jgi:hypothetical protein